MKVTLVKNDGTTKEVKKNTETNYEGTFSLNNSLLPVFISFKMITNSDTNSTTDFTYSYYNGTSS